MSRSEPTNLEQLQTLSDAISDQMEDKEFGRSLGIEDDHHVLYSGNPESKILAVQMYPDKSELTFALRENIHNKYVFTGLYGSKFKEHAKNAGFDVYNDLFYTNIIPFYPMAGTDLSHKNIVRLIWIFDGIMNIIKPKIIITLGYNAFNVVRGGSVDQIKFKHILKSRKLIYPLNNNEYVIAPLSDENSKERSFYSILNTLYINQSYILGDNHGR